MKLLLVVVLSLAFLVWGFWLVAVPRNLLADRIMTALSDGTIRAEVLSLEKGLFYNFSSDLVIQKSGDRLLSVENLKVRLNPLSLVFLKLPVFFQGTVGGGEITGTVDLLKKNRPVNARFSRVQIRELPGLKVLGLDGRGVLSGNITLEGRSGEMTFTAEDLSVTSWKVGGITVPLEFFRRARGAVTVGTDVITVTSFTLEGDGVYARVKGNIVRGNADLVMELMPEKSFVERTPLMGLLEQYRVSPGYYTIPVKRALS